MKKWIILACIASTSLVAQSNKYKTLPKAIVKFAPQNLLRNGLKVGVEFFNDAHQFSNQIMFETIYKSDNLLETPEMEGIIKRSGFMVDYSFKYYFNGLKVEKKLITEKVGGFYAGFAVNAGSYKQTQGMNYSSTKTFTRQYKAVDFKNTIYNFSVIGGIQKELSNRIYFDLFLGAGIQSGSLSYTIDDINPTELRNRADLDMGLGMFTRGVAPRGGFTVGLGI